MVTPLVLYQTRRWVGPGVSTNRGLRPGCVGLVDGVVHTGEGKISIQVSRSVVDTLYKNKNVFLWSESHHLYIGSIDR